MLIFNADDYGLTELDTERTLSAALIGIIRSTTVISTIASSAALDEIKHSHLSIGLHVNLTEGAPLTSCKSILDGYGQFLSKQQLLGQIMTGRVRWQELHREISAQLEVLLDAGIEVSHVDSHQYVHFIPPVLNCVLSAIEKRGVKTLRGFSRACAWFNHSYRIRSLAKNSLAVLLSRNTMRRGYRITDKTLAPTPGFGFPVGNVQDAIGLWRHAIQSHYDSSLIYDVPCHLYLSDLEYELYSSPQFSLMLTRSGVEVGSYHAIK